MANTVLLLEGMNDLQNWALESNIRLSDLKAFFGSIPFFQLDILSTYIFSLAKKELSCQVTGSDRSSDREW